MTVKSELTPEDLAQEASGDGYDPDQTWDDEPDRGDPDEVDDPTDHHDGEPAREV